MAKPLKDRQPGLLGRCFQDERITRQERLEVRKAALARLLPRKERGIRFVDHLEFDDGDMFFAHACALGCEGILSKRLGSRYVSGRSRDWIKVKNPAAPPVTRETEEDWS